MEQRRLKIGIFLDSYYPEIDGGVMVTDYVACALSEFNDVTMIIPDMGTEKLPEKPYEVIRVKSLSWPLSAYNYKVGILLKSSKEYKQILEKNFDVIHIHSPFTVGRAGVKIAKRLNIPVFATVHTRFYIEVKKQAKLEFLTKIGMKFISNVFNACDKIIIVNPLQSEELKKYISKHKPIVIGNATDLTPLKDLKNSIRKINEQYGLYNSDNVLLYVGRISVIKNIFFILESLRLLKQEKVAFKMLYVGSGPDEQKLQALIKEYNMDDCVQMTGRIVDREHLSAIYARADLFLFPSDFDTFGLVKLEAAVNETPGLFFENTMVANSIEDNVNGFLSSPDEGKYKDRIKEILSDKTLLKQVSVKARETMAVDWATIAHQYYNEYLKALTAKFQV